MLNGHRRSSCKELILPFGQLFQQELKLTPVLFKADFNAAFLLTYTSFTGFDVTTEHY